MADYAASIIPAEDPEFPLEEFLAAVAEQDSSRDFAFTEVESNIAGIAIREITLRQVLNLNAIGSPFLTGKGPKQAADCAIFLWYLSPQFVPEPQASQGSTIGRLWWKKQIPSPRERFIRSVTPCIYSEICAGIEAYLNRVFMDMPDSDSKSSQTPYTSFVASYVDLFASQYHWSRSAILDTPMAQLFQLLREMEKRLDSQAALINPLSDPLKDKWSASARRLSPEEMQEIKRRAFEGGAEADG